MAEINGGLITNYVRSSWEPILQEKTSKKTHGSSQNYSGSGDYIVPIEGNNIYIYTCSIQFKKKYIYIYLVIYKWYIRSQLGDNMLPIPPLTTRQNLGTLLKVKPLVG